jgi:hypothetical protein
MGRSVTGHRHNAGSGHRHGDGTGHRHGDGTGWQPALAILLTGLLAACALIGPDYPDLPIDQPDLTRLPAGVQPARLPADQAVRIAQAATGVSQRPAGVGRRLHTDSGRTVWVVMFITNREARPCGPAPLPGQEPGFCVTKLVGAVLDDEAGELVYSFEMGGELWPQE